MKSSDPEICPCCGQAIQLQDAPPKAKKALDDGFDSFWSRYPKKIGKGYCREIWKRKRLTPEDVLPALAKAITSPDWQKEGGKFIPNPSTYLNQGRFEDEGMDYEALKPKKATITSRLGVNEQEAFEWRCWVYPDSMLVHPTWNTFPFAKWPKSTQQEYLDSLTN